MKSGIYIIKNVINNKVYIGSAINISKRFSVHKSRLNRNDHHSKHLQNAWNKYGSENFTFDILEIIEENRLIEMEQIWMNFFVSYDDEFGYNICKVAGSAIGTKRTEESKIKMSKARVGKEPWNKGKENIYSEESKNKMRKAKIGKKWMVGKKASIESKNKMRNAKLGKKASMETKIKMSKSRTGKQKSGRALVNSKGDIFNSIKEAAKAYNYSTSYLYKMMQGFKKNITDLSYLVG
jgi:group I intron endonuclease